MPNYNRFIPVEEINDVEQWQFGAVDQTALLIAARKKAEDDSAQASLVAQVRQAALDEGMAKGHQQGFEEGFRQGQAQATLEGQRQLNDYISHQGAEAGRLFAQRLQHLVGQLADSEQAIAEGVLQIACELARQVVRRELTVGPDALLPVVREALGLLLADSRVAVVKVHPDDHAALEAVIQAEFPALALSVVAEPEVSPGGCLIEAGGSVIDGTVERRWQRALANLAVDAPWQESGDATD